MRHGITRKKKTGHAIEQDRPDVLSQRRAWFDGQLDLDPEPLVFIDEAWTATNMARSHGRCAKGERLRMGFPHGHRKTTALVAGLRMTGMVAPMVLDGPINGDWFAAHVRQVLVPDLKPGDIVILSSRPNFSIRAIKRSPLPRNVFANRGTASRAARSRPPTASTAGPVRRGNRRSRPSAHPMQKA